MTFTRTTTIVVAFLLLATTAFTQSGGEKANDGKGSSPASSKIVVITGNRFSYKLVQKWIDDYNKIAPNVQIIIESRGSSDPTKFDILAEVYTPDQEIR